MEFFEPEKRVKCQADLKLWEKSQAYSAYMNFLESVNRAITGKSSSTTLPEPSDVIAGLHKLLDDFDQLIDSIPPLEQPQRFGNQAYRIWHQKMQELDSFSLRSLLSENLSKASVELQPYLTESFGNPIRIDYGTGHEAAFLMFLCCLFELKLIKEDDLISVGLGVFPKYISLVRKLQQTYRMEPAGSQGVWALDDYCFIPFLWGSAQLMGPNLLFEPNQFLDEEILKRYDQEFMFLGSIRYIQQVKTGPFHEHSNQLYNISGVPTWSKVNKGLFKMYKAEVLGKFPVAQHFRFGSILRFEEK